MSPSPPAKAARRAGALQAGAGAPTGSLSSLTVDMGTVAVPGCTDGNLGDVMPAGCSASRTFFSQHVVTRASRRQTPGHEGESLSVTLGARGCWESVTSPSVLMTTACGAYHLDGASEAQRLNDLPKVTQPVGMIPVPGFWLHTPHLITCHVPHVTITSPCPSGNRGHRHAKEVRHTHHTDRRNCRFQMAPEENLGNPARSPSCLRGTSETRRLSDQEDGEGFQAEPGG